MEKKAIKAKGKPNSLHSNGKENSRQYDSPIKKTPTDEELEEALENRVAYKRRLVSGLEKTKESYTLEAAFREE